MTHFILPKTGGELRRAQILGVLDAALDAVDPVQAIRRVMIRGEHTLRIDGRAYDLDHIRRIVVVGGGKAGAAMAAAVEELLADRITAGVVNVKYGHGAPTEIVQIRESGHPVPDAAGAAGARDMLDLLRGLTAEDLVLCLISGGGSALMTLPVEGISLDDMQTLTTLLLRSGAPIQAINAVRKHLSQISGGQLARLAYPAQVVVADSVGRGRQPAGRDRIGADRAGYHDVCPCRGGDRTVRHRGRGTGDDPAPSAAGAERDRSGNAQTGRS